VPDFSVRTRPSLTESEHPCVTIPRQAL